MPISDELKRVYATAPTDDYYIETLQISHPALSSGSFYITNDKESFNGTLEDGITVVNFTPAPFAVVPPKTEDEAALSLQVALDNASLGLMSILEDLAAEPTAPIIIYYRVYLASDLATVQNDPPLKLDVLSVTATMQTVSFKAGLANLRRQRFPSKIYTIEQFPGLSR